jgi:hypothetical protein
MAVEPDESSILVSTLQYVRCSKPLHVSDGMGHNGSPSSS